VADHDRIDDIHGDPAEFSQGHRYGKREHVPDIAPETIPEERYGSDIGQVLPLSPRRLSDGSELPEMVQVMASHRFNNRLKRHLAAFGMADRFSVVCW
jgi:hypothetical protein